MARFDVIVDETPVIAEPERKRLGSGAAVHGQAATGGYPNRASCSRPLPEGIADELGQSDRRLAKGPDVPPELQQLIEQGKQRIQEL